jgi:hypothetical protein
MTTVPDLNAALAAYLPATFPSQDSLDRWLTVHCPTEQHAAINSAIHSVDKLADQFLFAEPGGVRFTKDFWDRLHRRLLATHPWITPESVAGMQAYLEWMCVHDGLFAPGEIRRER